MNLEAGQVGVVLFGSDRLVKEGETVKRTGEIVRALSSLEMPTSDHPLGRCTRWSRAVRSRCRCARQPYRWQGSHQDHQEIPGSAEGTRHSTPSLRQPTCADRSEVHRCHGTDRTRPA